MNFSPRVKKYALSTQHGTHSLHLAAFRGQADLALALVAAGASPNVPANDGLCALSTRPPSHENLPNAKPINGPLRGSMERRAGQSSELVPQSSAAGGHVTEPWASSFWGDRKILPP